MDRLFVVWIFPEYLVRRSCLVEFDKRQRGVLRRVCKKWKDMVDAVRIPRLPFLIRQNASPLELCAADFLSQALVKPLFYVVQSPRRTGRTHMLNTVSLKLREMGCTRPIIEYAPSARNGRIRYGQFRPEAAYVLMLDDYDCCDRREYESYNVLIRATLVMGGHVIITTTSSLRDIGLPKPHEYIDFTP